MANPLSYDQVSNGNPEVGVDRISALSPKEIEQLKSESLAGDGSVGIDQQSAKSYLQDWARQFGGLSGKPSFTSRPWTDDEGNENHSFFLVLPFKQQTVSVKSAGTGTLVNELMTLSLAEAKDLVMKLLKEEELQIAFFLKDRAAAQKRNGSVVNARGGVTGGYQFFVGASEESVEMDLDGLFDEFDSEDVDAPIENMTLEEMRQIAAEKGIALGKAKTKSQVLKVLEANL